MSWRCNQEHRALQEFLFFLCAAYISDQQINIISKDQKLSTGRPVE
jgi:hypothetical protein